MRGMRFSKGLDTELQTFFGINRESCSAKCKITYCIVTSFFENDQECWLGIKGIEGALSFQYDDSAVSEIFPQGPDYFFSILGFHYDTSAEQNQRYKIKSPVSPKQIRSLCAKFCRKQIDCKGFEVSMNTVYVHNCVLYSSLGDSLVESDIETDSETSVVAPSAHYLPIDQSLSFDLFVLSDNLLSDFNFRKECDNDYCCTEICKNDPVSAASVFDPSSNRSQCFHKTHSTNMSISINKNNSQYSDKAVTMSVFTEKLHDVDFKLTGFEFPDSIVT